jgi:hypothetical protein
MKRVARLSSFLMAQLSTRYSKLLLGANIVLAACLVLGVTMMFLGRGQGPSASLVSAQAQSVAKLLTAELERARQETRAVAELATHIFSNPESYRLAAQPDEYDYDQATGLYSSARDDGTSVAFLSAASALNPEILREIRLSEYLNPAFRTTAGLNPLVRSVALYTTDGLVRSYPWFDFRSRITSGLLKRNFSVTDLSFFAKAAVSRNPSKQGIWEVVNGPMGDGAQLVTAAPFFAGDTFRGVVAIDVDTGKLAAQLFKDLEPNGALGLLLAPGPRVLGTSRTRDSNNVKPNGLDALLRRLPNAEKFDGTVAGYQVSVFAVTGLPIRPVVMVPEGIAVRHYSAPRGLGALPAWLLFGVGLACVMLVVDAWWITQTRRNPATSNERLAESFTALSDLNLESALITAPAQAALGELYPKLDEGLLSIQKVLEASPVAPVSEEVRSVTESVGIELKQLASMTTIFRVFDVADSAEGNLNRLAAAMCSVFGVRQVSFLPYAGSAFRFSPEKAPDSADESKVEWKEGTLFDALTRSSGVVSSSTFVPASEEQRLLSPLIEDTYLALPLRDGERLIGAVVLSGNSSGFTSEDERFLGALQTVLSKTVQNIYQCDGFAKLNQLRREYCLELARAVEAPLHRIRGEVQSIYARLGKLTPYYKQHCETILFEVGKLYEMLREAREAEVAMESEPPGPPSSSEAALSTVAKKDSE